MKDREGFEDLFEKINELHDRYTSSNIYKTQRIDNVDEYLDEIIKVYKDENV